jgi:predicted DNA binding CopG/RHH family protein
MVKMGRPKLPPKARQNRQIALRLTQAEFKALEQAAAKAGMKLSNYLRHKLDITR